MNGLLVLALLAGEHIHSAENAFRIGIRAAETGDTRKAEKSFLQAIDIEPTFVDAYRRLIDLYRQRGQSTEAGAMLTRLLQIEPNSAPDRIRLGQLLLERGEWSRALAQFSAAQRTAPESSDALYGFACAAEKYGMLARARDAAERGAARFKNDPRFAQLLERLKQQPPADHSSR